MLSLYFYPIPRGGVDEIDYPSKHLTDGRLSRQTTSIKKRKNGSIQLSCVKETLLCCSYVDFSSCFISIDKAVTEIDNPVADVYHL